MTSKLFLKKKPTLQDLQQYVRALNKERGFKNTLKSSFVHLVSEVGELAKEFQKSDQNKKEIGFEIVDILIFLLDLANQNNVDLEKAFREKEEINKKRPWREIENKELPAKNELIKFNSKNHFFNISNDKIPFQEIVKKTKVPLSVILQITRECNSNCIFCSEKGNKIPDPTLEELRIIKNNLRGVRRVFLSGGEPLLRKDLLEIVNLFKDEFIIGLPTNAIPNKELAKKLYGKIAFVNVGLEGPRSITNKVRGDYDKIMSGILAFKKAGIPISLTAVVLKSTIKTLKHTCQIADVLEAGKLKLIMPIRKGNALNMKEEEFISNEDAKKLYSFLILEKEKCGWKIPIRMTLWEPKNEGYSILVYPNGDTFAWPVYKEKDKVSYLGNLKKMTIENIWKRYPYKENHLAKYLGKSIKTL